MKNAYPKYESIIISRLKVMGKKKLYVSTVSFSVVSNSHIQLADLHDK
jgi:hypothetical protein